MKILIVGDVHWSEYSSIVRKHGHDYSVRLENLINSVNWVEEQAELAGCDKIIFLGDFFDRSDLNAAEITALQCVQWSNIPHVFIVGNHEGLTANLSSSSAHIMKLIPQAEVISQPSIEYTVNAKFVYIPYILEEDRKPLATYTRDVSNSYITQEVRDIIIFSHNDLKMNYGMFESQEGFTIDEVEKNCSLFFNGHLHNGMHFCKNGYNVGNLTGQNFSEDGYKYQHNVFILDTQTFDMSTIVNPFAFNFYKIDVSNLNELRLKLQFLSNNAVLSIKVPETIVNEARNIITSDARIREYRIVSTPVITSADKSTVGLASELTTLNHMEEFMKYITTTMPVTTIVQSELAELCK